MDRRVRHHLRRARVAALAGPTRARTDLSVYVSNLIDALARLHADRSVAVELEIAPGLEVECDGQDVDEMLGNLVDNAFRWASTRVRISASCSDLGVTVSVADDGVSLSDENAAAVLMRGRRLDESTAGNGFGLPITLELAELYGGSLALSHSETGGLRANLVLPR